MSLNLDVFLKRANLPSREIWQQAITAEGVSFEFDDADPATHNGFWPCKLNGRECGFEYFLGPREPDQDSEPQPCNRGWWARLFGSSDTVKTVERDEFDELQEAIGDRDSVASFKWRGAHENVELDGRAASVAAAALAKAANGVFFDHQSGEFAIGTSAFELVDDEDD